MESAPAKQEPLLNRWLLLFIFAMILANLGGNMYGPFLSLYLQDLGASVVNIGLFFTLGSIIPLLLQILGGWISDTLGRLRSIAIGSVVGIFTYVALLLAPTWQWALVGMATGAITGSLVGPSFDAFIAEHSSEGNRARVFGISQTLFQIIAVIGPLLGGWLAQAYSFRVMLLVGGMLYVAATLIRVGMAREAARGHESNPNKLSLAGLQKNLGVMFGLLFSGGLITWILITDGVRDTAFALSGNLFPLLQQEVAGMTLTQIGVTNSVFGACTLASVFLGGWLADKLGERKVIFSGFLLIGVAITLLVATPRPTYLLFAIGWGVAGLGVGLMMPAYQSLISKAVPREVRGTAFGLFSTSLGLISLPMPYIGALLWENYNPRLPFFITAIALYLSLIPVWFKFHLPKKNSDAPTSSTTTSGTIDPH